MFYFIVSGLYFHGLLILHGEYMRFLHEILISYITNEYLCNSGISHENITQEFKTTAFVRSNQLIF